MIIALVLGGIPLLVQLSKRLAAGDFGSDLLAGMSIATASIMGEYLVGAIVVLMLSGGTWLEQYATRRASSVLNALAKRMPRIAHRSLNSHFTDISPDEIVIGERLIVSPHEICPVDGTVLEGHGCRRLKLPSDSRYAKIMQVMVASEQNRSRIRRIADRLGAWYTPVMLAATAGIAFGQNSDITAEAADALVLDPSPAKIDELMHISRRMRKIALQSALGGLGLSVLGMLVAAAGYLPPVAGAVAQEFIDVAAVLNALRMAIPPPQKTDF